jgi:hypothetical protein
VAVPDQRCTTRAKKEARAAPHPGHTLYLRRVT